MPLKRFSKLQADSQTLNQVQDALVRALDPVFASALIDGALVQGTSLSAGVNTIANPLLRNIRGVIPVSKNTFVDLHLGAQVSNPNPTKTILLTASTPAIVDLWIF